jgi:Ca2+-binding EF-hand superfamily protein
MQLKQAIRERFQAFDTSGDGTLCKKELKDAFASMVFYFLISMPFYLIHLFETDRF